MAAVTKLLKYVLPIILLTAPSEASISRSWLVADIGIIGVASSKILSSAMQRVEEEQLAGLIIQLDTPGGSLEETRTMVKLMMASKKPIIVWVGPSGARAASAGAFITLASHIAAMSPGTNIGAATPIQASGDDAAEKAREDTMAFIESIATSKSRNVELARSFVASASSITAQEALDNNIIEYIAPNLDSLMENLHGKQIKLSHADEPYTFHTDSWAKIRYQKTFLEQFLEILSHPQLFYLLFLGGLIGLGFELTHPGSMVPGVLGAISLILAFIASSVLPVNFAAMLLILLSIGLIVAEMYVPSFGILGIGGISAFLVGSFLLVDPNNTSGLRLGWITILPSALGVTIISMSIGWLILKSNRSVIKSGKNQLIGQSGIALTPFMKGRGRVSIEGENWQAQLNDLSIPIDKGDTVKVKKVENLCLIVEKLSQQDI